MTALMDDLKTDRTGFIHRRPVFIALVIFTLVLLILLIIAVVVAAGDKAYCGDGQVNLEWEECDDANNVDTDWCSNTCKTRTVKLQLLYDYDFYDYDIEGYSNHTTAGTYQDCLSKCELHPQCVALTYVPLSFLPLIDHCGKEFNVTENKCIIKHKVDNIFPVKGVTSVVLTREGQKEIEHKPLSAEKNKAHCTELAVKRNSTKKAV